MDLLGDDPSSHDIEELDIGDWWPPSSPQSPSTDQQAFNEQSTFGIQTTAVPDTANANASNSRIESESRSKRRRGRIYTGCLTCRNRKIKCDGRRPTCLNCERSRRYACKGYLNLPEEAGNSSSKNKQTRRGVTSTLDSHHSHPTAGEQSIRVHGTIDNDGRSRSQNNKLYSITTPIEHTHDFSSIQSNRPVSMDDSVIGDDIELFDLEAVIGFHEAMGFQRHLQENNEDDALLVHYRDVVSHLMMPTIDASRNPWLHIYVPMALIEPPTAGQLALRYALMSVAAYHLSQITLDSRQKLRQRAARHKETASKTLQDNLKFITAETPRLHKESFLAAAMALTSTNVFGDDRSNYNLNLRMAKRIIVSAGGEDFWKANARSMVLYQIFRCYNIVAATTAHALLLAESQAENVDTPDEVLEPDPNQETANILAEDGASLVSPFQIDQYVVETTFGIHLRTVAFLYRTVNVGASIGRLDKNSGVFPLSLGADIDCLKAEIDSFQRDSRALDDATPGVPATLQLYPMVESSDVTLQAMGHQPSLPKLISDELIRNHQWAFQCAVTLYFYRVIYPLYSQPIHDKQDGRYRNGNSSKQTRSRLMGHQNLVAKIFDHLENIDCLTRTRDTRPANILWPGFIGAVEAVDVELRQRALIWLQKTAQRGCGNAISAKELAMEIWRRVDRQLSNEDDSNVSLGSIDWRVVMSEMGLVIMLT